MDSRIGTFTKKKLSPFRRFLIDTLDIAMERHYVKAFLEFDVTDSRKKLREYKKNNNRNVSFLSWIIHCIGLALQKYPECNSMRKRNSVIQFDDIDVSLAIEMENKKDQEKVPRIIVIRTISQKNIEEINSEINRVIADNKNTKDIELNDANNVFLLRTVMLFPKIMRRVIWKAFLNNPFFVKKNMGTVAVTSLGMFGKTSGYVVPIPTTCHPVSFALGSIVDKIVVRKNNQEQREILHLTIFFDHDIVDGAPAARFTNFLQKLIESGNGLE